MKLNNFLKDTRARCLKFAKNNATRKADFHNQPDLACMCAVASHYLMHRMITIGKFKASHIHFVEGRYGDCGHAWLTYKDVILDITLTQFVKKPRLIITNRSKFKKKYVAIKSFRYTDKKLLKISQQQWGSQSVNLWTPKMIDKTVGA